MCMTSRVMARLTPSTLVTSWGPATSTPPSRPSLRSEDSPRRERRFSPRPKCSPCTRLPSSPRIRVDSTTSLRSSSYTTKITMTPCLDTNCSVCWPTSERSWPRRRPSLWWRSSASPRMMKDLCPSNVSLYIYALHFINLNRFQAFEQFSLHFSFCKLLNYFALVNFQSNIFEWNTSGNEATK